MKRYILPILAVIVIIVLIGVTIGLMNSNDQANTLKITDVKVGTGLTANSGDTVTVSYVGTLTNGKKFDSNNNFSFVLGTGQVIKGWDQGVAGMKVGGERKLVIPPSLGYGDQAAGSIPPGSTLDFDVKLLNVSSTPAGVQTTTP